jgi:hypothetical protein
MKMKKETKRHLVAHRDYSSIAKCPIKILTFHRHLALLAT